jgi:tetratricopeptide (TPR) repeat protein
MLTVMLICALPTLVHAAPENITDGELALLPEYCQDVQAIRYGNASYNPSPRAAHWVGLMGESFWALHHYCWGLIHVRRALQPGVPPVQRTGMITSAIGDYGYVIQNSPRDFILAPEIFLRIGEAQLLLGSTAGAADAFRTARELKPDYWPAYTRWIDTLLKTNQKAEAKTLAAEGLRYAPNAKELVDRYRKLGGDPSTIVPVVAAVAASVPSDGAANAPPTAAASSASAASR